MLIAIEALFVLLAVGGVAWWSIPAAMVLLGVAGTVACERASTDRGST